MPGHKHRSFIFVVQALFLVGLLSTAFISAAGYGSSSALKRTHKQNAIQLIPNSNNIPASGTPLKFGLYSNDPDPTSANEKLGRPVNIMAWFVHWDTDINSNKLRAACQKGYVPLITWESWGGKVDQNVYPLQEIASGRHDTFIKNQLRTIQNTCKDQTVIIRFDHEMDTPVAIGGWYPWQGNPSQYVAAWRHVVEIGHQEDPHIKWLWSPNRGTSLATLYYPGDKYTDYVGLTLNHGLQESQYTSFGQFYDANKKVIESFNKPVIIGETTSDASLYKDGAVWVAGMFEYLQKDSKITAVAWFNGTHGDSYDYTKATLDSFKKSLQDTGSK